VPGFTTLLRQLRGYRPRRRSGETVHVKAQDHGSNTLLDYAPPRDRTCAAKKPHRRNGKAKRGGDGIGRHRHIVGSANEWSHGHDRKRSAAMKKNTRFDLSRRTTIMSESTPSHGCNFVTPQTTSETVCPQKKLLPHPSKNKPSSAIPECRLRNFFSSEQQTLRDVARDENKNNAGHRSPLRRVSRNWEPSARIAVSTAHTSLCWCFANTVLAMPQAVSLEGVDRKQHSRQCINHRVKRTCGILHS